MGCQLGFEKTITFALADILTLYLPLSSYETIFEDAYSKFFSGPGGCLHLSFLRVGAFAATD